MPRVTDARLLAEFSKADTLSASSKEQYLKRLARWATLFPNRRNPVLHILAHPQEANQALHEADDDSSKSHYSVHMYLSAVAALLRHVPCVLAGVVTAQNRMAWKELQSENWQPIAAQLDSNQPTERQAKSVVPYEQIVAMRDQQPRGSDESVLLGLFTHIPPARGGDYHALRIVQKDDECTQGNCLVLPAQGAARILLRKFKTAKRHGMIQHVLPVAFAAEIRDSLKQRPRQHLFEPHVDDADVYTRSAFSKWANRRLKHLFGKALTLTLIRHAYISNTIDWNKPLSELNDIARSLGHTVMTSKRYQFIGSTPAIMGS